MKKIVFLLLFLGLFASAQLVEGIVVDNETNEALQNVKVSLPDSDSWILTVKDGSFKIDSKGSKFLKINILGYQESVIKVSRDRIKVRLNPVSLRIREVVINAKRKKFSEIEIKEEALNNTQAFSVADVLTQLPGQFVRPIDHSNFKNIVFRTASDIGAGSDIHNRNSYGNKAFGVSIVMDNITLSNNENMQAYQPQYNEAFFGGFSLTNVKSNVSGSQPNMGFDLREIVVGNIESIVVNEGIPDAKYGDLTSGLIKIETKAGKKPYRVAFSLNRGTYQVDVSKGYLLNNDGDALNVKLNYLNSNSNPRDNLQLTKRVSLGVLWGVYSKNKRLYNKLGLDMNSNFDEGRTDPDDQVATYVKVKKQGIRLTNNLTYKFEEGFPLDNVHVDLGFSYDKELSVRKRYVNNGGVPYGTALENSVYYAQYTLPTYFNVSNVEGIPISLFSNIDVTKIITTSTDWVYNLSLGINYRYGDNIGRGRYGSAPYAASSLEQGVNGFRDYNFENNVSALQQFSAYLQNNIAKNIDDFSNMKINAGMRFDLQNGKATYSPRLNFAYRYKDIGIRLGTGLTSKSPSLNQLYTGNRYLDYLIGDYRLPGHYTTAIMQTFVNEGGNIHLKPSTSWKNELGIDYHSSILEANVTLYRNQLKNGFINQTQIKRGFVSKVDVQFNGNQPPTYTLSEEKTPIYYAQSYLVNDMNSVDKGIEFILNFKKIKALNTEISMTGNYVETSNRTSVNRIIKITKDSEYVYGMYAPISDREQKMNVNTRISYHIPSVALIISLNIDNFILDTLIVDKISKYPIGYIDKNFQTVMLSENEAKNQKYSSLFLLPSESTTTKQGRILTNAHLRVSKDFINGIRASIYVNNFLNLKPIKNDLNETRVIFYSNFTPISFGVDVSYKF